jgi:Cu/Zn superoxide dismutase
MTKTPPEEPKISALAISQQLLVTGAGVPDGKAVLVAADTLVPAKRTVALTLPEGATSIAVSISWGTEDQVVANMEIEDLDVKSNKLSVGVHIHRDGSCHFILSDKVSGKSADASLKTPAAAAATSQVEQ